MTEERIEIPKETLVDIMVKQKVLEVYLNNLYDAFVKLCEKMTEIANTASGMTNGEPNYISQIITELKKDNPDMIIEEKRISMYAEGCKSYMTFMEKLDMVIIKKMKFVDFEPGNITIKLKQDWKELCTVIAENIKDEYVPTIPLMAKRDPNRGGDIDLEIQWENAAYGSTQFIEVYYYIIDGLNRC